MKKKWLMNATSILMVTSLGFLAAGCGSSSSKTAESSTKPVATTTTAAATKDPNAETFSITVSNWTLDLTNDPNKANANFVHAVENKYKEKYPNATIKWDWGPGDKSVEKLTAQLASNSAADVFETTAEQLPKFAMANYMADLSDQSWVPTLLAAHKSNLTINGQVYGLTNTATVNGVFYNKKMFTDNGWAVPKNWAEFLDLSEKIKAKGIVPLELGFKDGWVPGNQDSLIVTNSLFQANPNFGKDLYDGKVKLNGPEMKNAVSKWTELEKKGYFNKDALSASYDQAGIDWSSGKSAMFMSSSWMPGAAAGKNPSFVSGYFSLPDENGKSLIPVFTGEVWAVNAKSEHLQQAKDLIVVMADKDIVSEMLKVTGSVPARSGFQIQYSTEGTTDLLKAMETVPTHLGYNLFVPDSVVGAISTIITKVTAGGTPSDADWNALQINYDRDKSQVVPR